MPLPVILRPPNVSGRKRSNWYAFMSSTATSCPSRSSVAANSEPTRPQPMMTIFISLVHRLSAHPHLALCAPQHVLDDTAQLEFTKRLVELRPEDDEIDAAFDRLVDNGVAGVSCLEGLP